MSDERTDVIFGAKIADLLSGMKEAQAAVKEGVANIKEHVESINKTVEHVQKAFATFTAVLAGGELFEAAIEHTAELGAQMEVLSAKTGMAASELSRLRFAADISEVSAGSLDNGMVKMSRSMAEAAKGTGDVAATYAALGISVTDANGHLKPIQEVLGKVADKFHDMEDGAGKTAIAMRLFGRSGADLIPLLNQGSEEISKLENESDRLGNTMSTKLVEASVEYVSAMKRVHATVNGFKQSIAEQVLPSLTELANAFTQSGAASTATKTTVEVLAGAFRFLAATIMGLKYTFTVLWEEAQFVLGSIADTIGSVAASIDAAWHGNFAGAKAALSGIAGDVEKRFNEMSDNVLIAQQKVSDSMTTLFGFGPPKTEHEGPKTGGGNAAPVIDGTPKDRLGEWKEALAEMKVASKNQADDLLHDEVKFWQDKLALVTGGTKEDVKLRRQVNLEIATLELKLAGDIKKAAAIESQSRAEAALEAIDVERQAIEERKNLREIDANQARDQLNALATEEVNIKLTALNEQYDAAQGDIVKQAELWKQMESVQRAGSRSIATNNRVATQSIAADWERTFSTITDTIRKSFDGVIMGTQTFGETIRNMNRNLLLDFISSKATELQHHIAVEKAKEGATWGGVLSRIAAETWAGLQSVAITLATAMKNIAIYAAQAAAAAWASIAAIPFIGPVLAPAAAAATVVAVLGLAGNIRSASGGFDIPPGINPMTQLHAQEMVLPADLANRVRGMTDGGSGGDVHLHVHALDHRDVKQFMMEHSDSIADAAIKAAKNGRITPKKLGLG